MRRRNTLEIKKNDISDFRVSQIKLVPHSFDCPTSSGLKHTVYIRASLAAKQATLTLRLSVCLSVPVFVIIYVTYASQLT